MTIEDSDRRIIKTIYEVDKSPLANSDVAENSVSKYSPYFTEQEKSVIHYSSK